MYGRATEGASDGANLAAYLLAGADGVALESADGEVFSRGQLRTATAALADAFSADGLTKSRVGLDLSPTFPAVAAYLALLLTGNTVVLARRIERPPWPKYLASASLDGIVQAQDGVLGVRAFGELATYEVPTADGDVELPAPVPNDDAAVNLFTSGTTGQPKIVEHTADSWIASTEAILAALPLGPSTRTALILSLAHSFGLSVLHTHLRAGASLYCVERPEFGGDVLRAFTERGCNAVGGVPAQLRSLTAGLARLADKPESIRLVMQAGGRFEVDDAEALLATLTPEAHLYCMYGQTEAAARITIHDAADRARVPGSVGRPIQGSAVRIVDAAGEEVPTGQEGEVTVSGPNVMSGYYENPAATAQTLRDGWLHTGDFGYVDAEGFLYVTGRRSNFVKISGERISLEAVEHTAISTFDEIDDALALPFHNGDDLGRGGRADDIAIELKIVMNGSPSALTGLSKQLGVALRSSQGPKGVPAKLTVVDEIPYTPNGKKQRPNLTY